MNEQIVDAYVAELVKVGIGENPVAITKSADGEASLVLTENGRAYRVRSVVTVEEIS